MKTNEPISSEWMIRSCSEYKDEYQNCSSIKDRFHQYYVHGKKTDCTSWKNDYNKCLKWEETKDEEIAKEISESEMKRREERLKPHFKNDVWAKRDKPPEDWDAPLPEWMLKKLETSYLNFKSREKKEELKQQQTCTIQ